MDKDVCKPGAMNFFTVICMTFFRKKGDKFESMKVHKVEKELKEENIIGC